MLDITSKEQQILAQKLKEILAEYKKNEDLITIGAYHFGTNPKLDEAIQLMPSILDFLKQPKEESESFESSFEKLKALFSKQHS